MEETFVNFYFSRHLFSTTRNYVFLLIYLRKETFHSFIENEKMIYLFDCKYLSLFDLPLSFDILGINQRNGACNETYFVLLWEACHISDASHIIRRL